MANEEKKAAQPVPDKTTIRIKGMGNSLLIGLSLTFIILILLAVLWSAIRHFSSGGDLESWLGLGGFTAPDGVFYPARTLWDWLNLLILPAILFISFLWFNRELRERGSASPVIQTDQALKTTLPPRSQETERELFAERLREDALQNYFEQMTDLLLERDLRTSQKGSEVRALARARTLTTLQALDEERKSAVLRFLVELGLVSRQDPVISFAGVDLSKVQLPQTRLSAIDLKGANLEKANLFHAEMGETLLAEADLRSADLRWANLANAKLQGADLSSARLFEADLTNADLSDAKLVKADLSTAKLEGAVLHNVDLREATLAETQLQGVNLTGASLIRANLMGANLVRANLQNTNLNKADLRNADLTGVDLKRAKLVRANLTAILREADIRWADLTEVNLSGADLQSANLRDADLTGAVLRDANLTDVLLIGANLTNTVLEGAKVTNEQLKMTLSLQGAVMPDGKKYDPAIHPLS